MDSLWNKNVLPMDWAICHASLKSIKTKKDADVVISTYQYVEDNFVGHTNWIHGMAIIWGILFSRVAPFICHSKEDIDFSDRNNPVLYTPPPTPADSGRLHGVHQTPPDSSICHKK